MKTIGSANRRESKKISSTMKKHNCNEMLIQMTHSAKPAKKSSKAAKARSVSKKESSNWDIMAKNRRYSKAVAKDLSREVTAWAVEECLDGICLNLSDGNCMRSDAVQKRILRRIVEKRQAQANHRRVGRTQSLLASYLEKSCCSSTMAEIHHARFCL